MALGCAAAAAHAQFRPEIGIGAAQFSDKGDGTWYQQSQPYGLSLSVPTITLGLTGDLYTRGDWGVAWHADYVWLGNVSADCSCTPVDANYSTTTHMKNNTVDVPDALFSGHGQVQGVALTVEPYYWSHGFRFAAEAGLFPYLWHWSETVNNWSDRPGMTPYTIAANSGRNLSLGEVVGVSVSRGPFTVAYRHYFLPTQGANGVPPIWKGADMLEVRYKF